MKTLQVFVISICLIYFSATAQEKFSASGVLMDFAAKQPIEFASVAIYKIPSRPRF